MLDIKKTYKTNNYGDLKIVTYHNNASVDVEFISTGYRATVRFSSINRGAVKDKLYPRVYGVGFLGTGKHKAAVDGKRTKAYATWTDMLERCYSDKAQARRPTYKGCSVAKEWHNFQNFSAWFNDNYSDGLHLDKDILIKGNRVYSPEACMFVTRAQNNIEAFAKHYKFISPKGELVEIYNLLDFCKKNELNNGGMSAVHSGKLLHHKQWMKA